MIVLAAVTIGCKQDSTLNRASTFARIKKDGTLRVGYILASPWVVRNPETGALSGTFVDAINEIAQQMEVKLEFVETDFATFTAGLQSRKYDLSIAPTFVTIPRAKSVAFTVPIMAAGNSGIVRKGEKRFKTVSDIDQDNIVVAVTQGEQGHEYAKMHFKRAKIRVFSGPDQSLAFSEVLAGRADVALGDAWFTSKFAAEHANAKDLFAEAPYNLTPVGWAVRYDDLDLLVFINTCLEYLDTIGKLDEIDRSHGVKWLRPQRLWKKT